MSTITKLSQDVIQYYKNITSPIGANMRIQRDIQILTVQKMLTSDKRKTREMSKGAGRKRILDGLLEIHAFTVSFLSATRRIHKLQAPEFRHADPRELEFPN